MAPRSLAIDKPIGRGARSSDRVGRFGFIPSKDEDSFSSKDWKRLETLVFERAAEITRTDRDTYALQHSPGSGDRGIDLLMIAKAPFSLFRLQFAMRGKSEIRAAFQCKAVGQDHVTLEKLMHSVELAKHQQITDFILVTNKAITPRTHYTVSAALKIAGVRFEVVEGWRLADSDNQYLTESDGSPFGGTYQFSRDPSSGNPLVDVFVYLRNITPNTVDYLLALQSDHNWSASDGVIENSLGPYESASWLLQFRQSHQDGVTDLVLSFDAGGQSTNIILPSRLVEFEFLPRFFGETHQELVGDLVSVIDDYTQGHVVFIRGAAGSGKSRITEEAYRRRATDDIRFLLVRQDQKVDILAICDQIANLTGMPLTEKLDDALSMLADSHLQTVVILDDLHNAQSEVIAFANALIAGTVAIPSGVCVIVSGRDDDSFVNPDYLRLLDVADQAKRQNCHLLSVPPFTDTDTRRFIRATVRDLPRAAADLIFRLSQNNPFNIIQIFEHLLDRKIARIISSQIIGIVNVAGLEASEALPRQIEDILKLRVESLRAAHGGEIAADLLLGASYLGVAIPKWIFAGTFGPAEQNIVELDLLRRKLISDQIDGALAFGHENIHLYLRGLLKGEVRERIAILLLRWDGRFACLTDLQRGELHLWAGQIEAAKPYLEPALHALDQLENPSAATLNPLYLRFADTLFEFGRITGVPMARLGTILKAKIYLALHNGSPHQAIRACDSALETLISRTRKTNERNSFNDLILQYKAHALINAGQLLPAYRIMRELETSTEVLCDRDGLELRFDLLHRLYDIYMKWNHFVVAKHYLDQGRQVVDRLIGSAGPANRKYIGLHCLLDEAVARLFLLKDPAQAHRLMSEAIVRSRRDAPERNNLHNELTLLVSEIQLHRTLPTHLRKLIPKVRLHLDRAIDANFLGSIPRCYLILATLNYLSEPHSTQEAHVSTKLADAGINFSLRRGYMTYVWMLYNLKGVVGLRGDASTARINAPFETMLRYLKSQGLLFLGNRDDCYPNSIALGNYFRWRLETKHSERDLARGLESLSAYEYDSTFNPSDPISLIRSIQHNGSLSAEWPGRENDAGPLFDPSSGYWLALF
jgi:hypothetical protein